jgi:riboflavin kinase/FMN adenylyltransferase
MQIVSGLNEVNPPLRASVVTIGNFDGMHLGHRALISQVIEKSNQLSCSSAVVTFDPHPSRILRPDQPVLSLFSRRDLEEELRALGVQVLVIQKFTREFARTSAEDFIVKQLLPSLHPRELVVGHDFTFGRDREGTFSSLRILAEAQKFKLTRCEPVLLNGEIVSSSLIRRFIQEGEVEKVSGYLKRPYYVEGLVVSGDSRGAKLGFATANLKTAAELMPLPGVYITQFTADGRTYPSLTNVGFKPTFHTRHELTIETHVLDVKKEFGKMNVRVTFLKRLRAELKFANAEELVHQIKIDVETARHYFSDQKLLEQKNV